jgi:hypothetical protein
MSERGRAYVGRNLHKGQNLACEQLVRIADWRGCLWYQ